MPWRAGAHICRCIRRPGIDSEELIRKFRHHAGIFKQSMGTRNRVGIGLLYRYRWEKLTSQPFPTLTDLRVVATVSQHAKLCALRALEILSAARP
jgi:hypothetical protein